MKRIFLLFLVIVLSVGILSAPVEAKRKVPTVTIVPDSPYAACLWRSRAVMQPYAKIYADASLGGTEVANLKRYDRFYIRSVISDSVVYGDYHILSGHGRSVEVNKVNGYYSSPDDTYGSGYISTEAFYAPSLEGSAEDKQRDVVELAYTRLGLNGVYSQGRRFMDVYLDCAAMVSFCWYQVGIDFNKGGGTAVSGLVAWGHNHHAVLWQTKRNTDKTVEPIRYGFDPSFFSKLEPGDLIIYYDPEEDVYPHVSLCVEGGSYYANIIETNNPRVNTVNRTIVAGDATASKIGMIVRPTGCTEDKTSGIELPNYAEVYKYFPKDEVIKFALYADELALGPGKISVDATIKEVIDAIHGSGANVILDALGTEGDWASTGESPKDTTYEAVLSALLNYLVATYN